MKIVTILGARPQFIKAGTVSREIFAYNEEMKILNHQAIDEIIIHTGQHYDTNMSDIFFQEMKIPKPNYNLGIGGKSHGAMTGQMLENIEVILMKEKPDWVLVYGDTNSTLAGALAASKLNIKIAHIEAGLRSFNMQMPEEINRILTDRLSSILFSPTITAVNNLKREKFPFKLSYNQQKIINVGDVMLDGAVFYRKFEKKPNFLKEYQPKITKFILCTIHRAQNTDNIERLKVIFQALKEIAKQTPIVLPLHPRTKGILESESFEFNISNILIIDPIGYLNMVWLINHSNMIITDSGGLQKESYFFSKHCIVLRDETEWIELIDSGYNYLAGANYKKIMNAYKSILSSNPIINTSSLANHYGDGTASKKIIWNMLNYENSTH